MVRKQGGGTEQLAHKPRARWLRPLHTTFYIHLRAIHSLLLLKSGKGRNTLLLNNSYAALLYQHNALSCRKQRRKQQP